MCTSGNIMVGSECMVTCDDGYTIDGSNTVSCGKFLDIYRHFSLLFYYGLLTDYLVHHWVPTPFLVVSCLLDLYIHYMHCYILDI